MTPVKRKLTIYQGATFAITWRLRSKRTKQPIDLTGCLARMHIRAELESPDVLLELTTEDGRITVDGPGGEIRLHIEPGVTAAIDWDAGVWDLEIVHPGGQVSRLFMGSVSVSQEVTRG